MNVGLEIELDEADLQALAGKMDDVRKAVKEALPTLGMLVETQIKQRMQEKNLVSTGNLWNSVRYIVRSVDGEPELLVGATAHYAAYVEFGTVPHFVPFKAALSLYNQARLQWGWRVPGGKQARYKQDANGDLWLIPPGSSKPRKGVRVKGTAKPFVYPGWQAALPALDQKLTQILQAAIQGGG